MIIIYTIVSIFIAWIWVDYYRLIDIFEKEKFRYILITFLLGATSVLIVDGIDLLFGEPFISKMTGNFFNDFLYCTLNIGLIEEFAKIIPFLIVLKIFKNQINEPIDYLAFISVSALGFSAAENVLYFSNYGPSIISGRAILSSVGHMFDTSIFAYGIILIKYRDTKYKVFTLLAFYLLAALSHGIYDFWLMFEGVKSWGWIMTVFYFFFTISIYSTILNNCLNNSSFFNYKTSINSDKITFRLLIYYAIIFVIQLILLAIKKDLLTAVINFRSSIIFTGFIITITVIRLSRYKLIHKRWNKIKFELPFVLGNNPKIRIKGEAFNESYINQYFEEYFHLKTLPARNGNTYSNIGFIERKIFLKNDETFYLTKIFTNEDRTNFTYYLIKPKTHNMTRAFDKYPIIYLLQLSNIEDIENTNFTIKDFPFIEWRYILPLK